MATKAQILPNRLTPPQIELCSNLILSKGLPCVAFCEAGSSVFGPLHLSRTLYKSAPFMQNKPNFRKAKMKLNFYSTKGYENKPRLRAPGKQTQFMP